MSDEELVREVGAAPPGDLRAFEVLVKRYESAVRTNCSYLGPDPGMADDLAQEVFLRAYFGIPRFEGRASFRTWLWRVKANHCLNAGRRRRPRIADLDDPAVQSEAALTTGPEAHERVERGDTRALIDEVLAAMNETLRVPLVLREVDGFSYEEIAEQLGIGLSAAKMRVKRGREEFRTRYEARLQALGEDV